VDVLMGTSIRTMDETLDWLQSHRINALRIPFALTFAL
jgi:aryl-phospho-beta-D-glucosidase BglC (GH1 family)